MKTCAAYLIVLALVLTVSITSAAFAQTLPEPLDASRRCTDDGETCITLDTYIADVCALIERSASENGLDPGYFARLLWKESLFDAAAISPAGAQGIAQFMPATAKLRGLEDPFNPAQAIQASAAYLGELSSRYGNEGLAAVAYNAGEARADRFVSPGSSILPRETLNYVSAITGHTAAAWRDTPPDDVDYRLDGATAFQEACRAQAAGRAIREFRDPVPPWGVIIAAGRRQATVERYIAAARARNPALLGDQQIGVVRAPMPGFGTRQQLTAQVPVETRAQARQLCAQLSAAGSFCLVIRN